MKLRIALCASLFLLGCKSVPFITKDGAAPATPAADHATIVVGQTYTYPQVNLIDDKGAILGQVGPRQYTVFSAPAGAFHMAAFPGNDVGRGDRVEGTVEAGKVYYFVVAFRMGGITLQTITPRNDKEEWNNRKTYTRDLSPVTMESARVGELEKALGEDRLHAFADIDGEVKGWTPEELKNRQVEPADGDPGT